MLFLNIDGTVKGHQKISDTQGGFTGILDDFDGFGFSVAFLGDLDGDDVGDLAVGAIQDDDGGVSRGAVWVLFLNTDGTVKSHQKISDTQGGFTGILDNSDQFGISAASLGDLDGDGVGDLAVGVFSDDDGGDGRVAGSGPLLLFLRNMLRHLLFNKTSARLVGLALFGGAHMCSTLIIAGASRLGELVERSV